VVVLLAFGAFAALAPSGAAFAEDADARVAAKERLEKGADLLVTHAYARALDEFEDAYRIFPSPKIFFDVGLANAGLGRNPDALRAFQRFLIEAGDASADSITRAKAQIQLLLPKVAVVDIVCPKAGLEIVVDDRSVGRAPLAAPLYLDPGSHRLLAKENDATAPIVTTFEVAGGARVSVSVPSASTVAAAPLPAAAPAVAPSALVDRPGPAETAPAEPAEPRLYQRPWFWAATAGVVAAVGLTLLLTVGRSKSDPTASLGSATIQDSP
jgi:hypothetical protein